MDAVNDMAGGWALTVEDEGAGPEGEAVNLHAVHPICGGGGGVVVVVVGLIAELLFGWMFIFTLLYFFFFCFFPITGAGPVFFSLKFMYTTFWLMYTHTQKQ